MNCGHNYNLDYTIKLRYNRHDLKIENFPLLSLSLHQGWLEEEGMMNSSGVECEVCVVHFKRIKGESGLI